MSRRRKEEFSRDIGVDLRFGSPLVQKLINTLMRRGKKNLARTIVDDAFDIMIKKYNGDEDKALEVFNRAMVEIAPVVAVKPKRVGGSVYQIPTEVPKRRSHSLALRWLITAAKSRSDKTMGQRLAYELLDAYDGRGGAVKKKTDVQRMAEANRAFSHYAW